MRRLLPLIALALLFAPSINAGQFGSRTMTGWFNVRTEDGWTGRRYMDGQETIAEEFDSNRDGNIDVWRFYRRGILSSEERDQNFDGVVDFVSHWDSRNGFLLSVLRDTHQRGVNDIEVEYVGGNRWEIREDRNYDGITDRIIYAGAPPDIFNREGVDMASQVDIASTMPLEFWTEMWSDDGFSGRITDYFRYSRGVLTHHGLWNGRRIAWTRVPPDFVPPSPTPATPPGYQGMDQYVRRDPEGYAPPPPGPPPIRDPFDLRGDGLDPYAGIGPVNPEPAPVWGGQRTPPPPRGDYGQAPIPDNRGNYGVLPRDESSARAVPARMRDPGQSATESGGNRRRSRR